MRFRRRQRGTPINAFCEVRWSRIHGRGVFARRPLGCGQRLLEYVGELVGKEEANRRGLEQQARAEQTGEAAVFIFDLNDEWDLDGNKPWNPARLVNHACTPNCRMHNEGDRLFLETLRAIRPGEELTFDYGYELQHYREHPCRCGSPDCVGYIVRKEDRRRLRNLLAQGRAPSSLKGHAPALVER